MGDEAWSRAVRSELSHSRRRVVSRDAISFQTHVSRPRGADPVEVELIDFSVWGFQARCGFARFERGEPVALRLPLITTQDAQIRWSLRGCFGAQFLQPIDARAYLDILARITRPQTDG
ncbi:MULTISPECIES: hypothetical protein [unclassified Sphingobium]|uniref:hypothetical protein n=1 Tax=unclassified Sphingobium TaxID=2611147 RepID=UPI0022251826|nr:MULTISPECIES: hypothetical protein [unclassified Sphingobium]MCW2411884.1 hypothetical protein [Sphingobium sp. B8D3D]MCW2415818.1 hypothetical protein [Sphingobium sp. B8D3A]